MSEISGVRRYYWSLRREWWENPGIWVAPAVAAVLVLISFTVSRFMPAARAVSMSMVQRALLSQPYEFAEGMIMLSTLTVAFFYTLDTLYGERRDRSILFWKSLPVSDVTTVLAKITVPLLILPLMTVIVSVATFLVMMLIGGIAASVSGDPLLATHPPLATTSWLLLYHMLTMHSLWWAPFFGWMLLVSAWAKRTPFVWAVVPVIAVWSMERIAFNTSRVAALLSARLAISPASIAAQGRMPTDPMTHLTPLAFFTSPGLLTGLAVTVIFVFLATRLRRYRGPI